MFCEVFFEVFFRKSTGAREPSAWASLAKGGTRNPKTYRETNRKAYALQQHVKHHRFVSESGCKSTAYLRICKLIPTFFSDFPISFMQIADLQLCSIAGFWRKGKGRQKQDTLFISRTRIQRALQLQLQFTIREKTRKEKETVLWKEENDAFRKRKQCFSFFKWIEKKSSSTGNSFLRHENKMCKNQPKEVHKPDAGCRQAEEKMCTSCNEEKNRRSKNKRGLQTASKRSVCKPLFAFIKTMNYLNGWS